MTKVFIRACLAVFLSMVMVGVSAAREPEAPGRHKQAPDRGSAPAGEEDTEGQKGQKGQAGQAEEEGQAPAESDEPLPLILTSERIDVAACPADETGSTRRCPEVEGYALIETQTDDSDFRLVVDEKAHFQMFLEPDGCDHADHEGDVKWLLYNGKPFALIHEVECKGNSDLAAKARGRRGKKANPRFMVVRGVKGFEALQANIAIKGRPGRQAAQRAEKEARRKADDFIKAAWPALSRELKESAPPPERPEQGDEAQGAEG